MPGVRSSSGTLICLASGAAFGAMAIFGKLAYDEGASVGTLLSVRFTLAAALFWALSGRGAVRTLGRRDVLAGLALGAGGYALQAGCYFAALERIDASLLSLLLYTFPAIVAAAAVALGRERIDGRRLAALGLGAAVVYSAYILVGDGVARRVPARELATLVCTGAAVSLTAGSLLLGDLRPGALTPVGWGWLASLAAISTVGAISLFFAGLRRVGPTAASILATVEPLVTVVLAFLVFDEALEAVQVAGGVLLLAAVPVLQGGRANDDRSTA